MASAPKSTSSDESQRDFLPLELYPSQAPLPPGPSSRTNAAAQNSLRPPAYLNQQPLSDIPMHPLNNILPDSPPPTLADLRDQPASPSCPPAPPHPALLNGKFKRFVDLSPRRAPTQSTVAPSPVTTHLSSGSSLAPGSTTPSPERVLQRKPRPSIADIQRAIFGGTPPQDQDPDFPA